ncbi:MAG: MinD/ParA family protein [Desulfovibrionaceae bacterium]|nr:MinD/ParA family protein [Desulfovibrionaceae bacterium]
MKSAPIVFTITSGKGGVGKTNIAINIAYSLAQHGKRVVVLDADLSLANVDVLLGIMPKYNLFHVLYDGVKVEDILYRTQYGFDIIPASSGVSEMLELDTGQKLDLLAELDAIENKVDYLIVDTGAGINDNVLYFNIAAQERLVVLTPDPTSLTDAYALIKVLQIKHKVHSFKVVVNMVENEEMAKEIFHRLHTACDHFLQSISLEFAGFVPRDPWVRDAVLSQQVFSSNDEITPATQAIQQVARTILRWDGLAHTDGNIKFFWKKLLFR